MALPDELRKAGHPPSWAGYVAVEDVDRTAQRLAELGGTVHRPPTDVPGIIRFAVVADSQGAGFVLAKPLVATRRHRRLPARPAPSDGMSSMPPTPRWPSRYEKMFGWTKAEAIDMAPMGIYQLFASGDTTVGGGMMNKPAVVPGAGLGLLVQCRGDRCRGGPGGCRQRDGAQWPPPGPRRPMDRAVQGSPRRRVRAGLAAEITTSKRELRVSAAPREPCGAGRPPVPSRLREGLRVTGRGGRGAGRRSRRGFTKVTFTLHYAPHSGLEGENRTHSPAGRLARRPLKVDKYRCV